MAKQNRFNPFLAAALLVAVAAAFPLLSEPGLLNSRGGGDSPFLLQRLHQLETAVLQGHFPVRWMPDANYGYGYPFYNYYAPLSIYITFIFRLVGFSYVRAIQLSQLAGFMVAAWGMFALAKRWFGSEWAGLLTAVAYTTAPFHLVNVYVRGDSLAEFWAMAFYPLVILAADNLMQGEAHHKRRIATFAAAYAALILSHNISAMIFSPFLLLYILLRWLASRRNQPNPPQSSMSLFATAARTVNRRSLFFAFLLAFALSAWFFVPALAEQDLVQLGTVTEGYFHFSTHFLGTQELSLVQDSFFFDYGVNGRSAFRMGLVQAILAIMGMILLFTQRRKDAESSRPHSYTPTLSHIFILLTITIATLMMTPLSTWLWQHLPLLSFTQFPWRFLSVQAFGIALAMGSLARLPVKRWIVPLAGMLLAISSFGNLQTDHLMVTDVDVTAVHLAQYEWFTGNIGTTVSAEYLPTTVTPRPYTSHWLNSGNRDRVVAVAGELTAVSLTTRRTAAQSWELTATTPATIRFDTLYWPGWRAEVDGEAVAIRPSPGSGLITLDLPAGAHVVELRLGRTPVRLIAELLSLTAVLLLLWLFNPVRLRPNGRVVVLSIGLILTISLIVRLWPDREETVNTLSWDFAEMGYLHSTPGGIPFDDGSRLLAYSLSTTEVTAGDLLELVLHWQAPAPEATVAFTFPADNWPDIQPAPPVLVSETVQGETAVYTFTIPHTAPSGLVVPRMMVENGRALTPSGKPRGILFLQPIRIVPQEAAGVESSGILDVAAVSVTQTAPERLELQLAWQTKRPLNQNLNMNLRLTDANGNFLRLLDRQPGEGFLPTSLWPVNQPVYDWLTMPLPGADEGHQLPFVLVAHLYDVTNPTQPLLTRRLGELMRENGRYTFQPTMPQFVLPEYVVEETAVFGDIIRLHGYTVNETADTITATLVWQSLTDMQIDYTRFVHLIDAAKPGPPLVNVDTMPRNGSYPTSQWIAGEVISETVTLPLTHIPSGEYQVAVGFYILRDGVFERLTAVDTDNIPLSENRFVLPSILEK